MIDVDEGDIDIDLMNKDNLPVLGTGTGEGEAGGVMGEDAEIAPQGLKRSGRCMADLNPKP